MKNKKLALLLVSSTTCVGIGVVAFAGVNAAFESFSLNESNIQPGVIAISATDPNINPDGYTGYFHVNSLLGNSFEWFYRDITKENGIFTFGSDGTIANEDAIRGIYRIEINCPVDQTLDLGFRLEDGGFYGSQSFDLKEGNNSISVSLYNPTYVLFAQHEDEGFQFNSILLYYSCEQDYIDRGISYVRRCEVEGYTSYDSSIYVEEGTKLNEIDLTKVTFETSSSDELRIDDMNNVSNLEISYTVYPEASEVLPGVEAVNISFIYNNYRYSGEVSVAGYDHLTQSVEYIGVESTYFLQQETNNIPEGFNIIPYCEVRIYDSNDNMLNNIDGSGQPVQLTQAMIVNIEANPFTEIGEHQMDVSYGGHSNTIYYQIYNPEYCNIQSIRLGNTYEVTKGTTKAEFLEQISDFDFSIVYFEDNPSLPHTTKLNENNFPTLTDDTFNTTLNYVDVDVEYGNYVGTIEFNIHLEKGNLLDTYNNTTGVSILYGMATLVSVELYDNGVANLIMKNSSTDNLSAYTLDGTHLTVSFMGMPIDLTINNGNKSFDVYTPDATLLRSFTVDFSALDGGPSDAGGKMYDNGTIEFIIYGFSMYSTYTVDGIDDHLVYFSMNDIGYIGTFNQDYSVMAVTLA